jgi:hypothetical protein
MNCLLILVINLVTEHLLLDYFYLRDKRKFSCWFSMEVCPNRRFFFRYGHITHSNNRDGFRGEQSSGLLPCPVLFCAKALAVASGVSHARYV